MGWVGRWAHRLRAQTTKRGRALVVSEFRHYCRQRYMDYAPRNRSNRPGKGWIRANRMALGL